MALKLLECSSYKRNDERYTCALKNFGNIDLCPCTTCLVKPMCKVYCKSRKIILYKLLQPYLMSEKDY
jgi:hypothetical protein